MKQCKRCGRDVKSFPLNAHGKPSTMCVRCYKNTKKRNAKKVKATKALKASLPVGMKMCMGCQNPKELEEFKPNPGRRRALANGQLSSQCFGCRERRAKERREGRRDMTPEQYEVHRIGRRDYSRKFRIKLLDAYGPYCRCCGETTVEFLEMHHVNEDGAEHRRQIGRGPEALYRWAQRHGFPDTLAVTCANCHAAETYYGGCPHKKLSVLQLAVTA